jgi:hypothetical protein
MARMRDPNWTGPGPGPFINIPDAVPAATPMPTSPRQSGWTGPGPGPKEPPPPEEISVPVYAGGTPKDVFDESAVYVEPKVVEPPVIIPPVVAPPVVAPPAGPILDAWGRDPSNPNYGVDFDAAGVAAKAKIRQDSRVLIDKMLRDYKIDSSLKTYLYSLIADDRVDLSNEDALYGAMRDQPEFMKRFSANAIRAKNDLPELDPSSYLAMEESYLRTLQSNGMPSDWYDQPSDFTNFIANNISNADLQTRIKDGYRAVKDADPEVLRQLTQLYNVTEGELAAFYLDPKKTAPLLVTKTNAAKLSAQAKRLANMQLSSGSAEGLVALGTTEEEAKTGFAEIGKLGELTTQMAGETAISQEQIIGQQFGNDTGSALELEKRKRRRLGEFAGGGSFARTQGETSGAVTTSIGKAQ